MYILVMKCVTLCIQPFASLGTRPLYTEEEEGLVPRLASDWLCPVSIYWTTWKESHIFLILLLHMRASGSKISCMQKICTHEMFGMSLAYHLLNLLFQSNMFTHTLQVKVCHVSNATRLWVSLLQHSPQHRGEKPVPCHDPSVFVKLTLDLAHFYSNPNNKRLHG